MPNVQLPPKESNLFKRILVSGRRPRCRSPGAPGPARRAVWRGRLRWPARLPHGSLFSSEPARPQCPPRLGPAGPPASPAGRRGHRACPRASSLRSGSPGPRRAPSRNFTSPSAVPGRGRAGRSWPLCPLRSLRRTRRLLAPVSAVWCFRRPALGGVCIPCCAFQPLLRTPRCLGKQERSWAGVGLGFMLVTGKIRQGTGGGGDLACF